MSTAPNRGTDDELENARTEYAATNDAYMHYDNFSWQVGSVLLAGVFVYWGFIVSTPPLLLALLLGNLLVCLLMSVWLLYTEHNRQIYLFKLHRIHELEARLGMHQHRRFRDRGTTPYYRLDPPVGHHLDDLIYVIVTLGGLLPGLSRAERADWRCTHGIVLAVTFIIVACTIWHVHRVDARAKRLIDKLHNQGTPGPGAA